MIVTSMLTGSIIVFTVSAVENTVGLRERLILHLEDVLLSQSIGRFSLYYFIVTISLLQLLSLTNMLPISLLFQTKPTVSLFIQT